jgi:WD40 repeat protein
MTSILKPSSDRQYEDGTSQCDKQPNDGSGSDTELCMMMPWCPQAEDDQAISSSLTSSTDTMMIRPSNDGAIPTQPTSCTTSTTTGISSTIAATTSTSTTGATIPLDVLTDHIIPFIPDRKTWNAIALTCQDVYRIMNGYPYHHGRNTTTCTASSFIWPWPEKVHPPRPDHLGVVTCVAFSPVQKELSSPSSEKTTSSSSSPISLSLMACGSFFRINLFESRLGHVRSFESLQGTIKSLAFSSTLMDCSDDNDYHAFQYLAACSSGSNPRIWRIYDKDCLPTTSSVSRKERQSQQDATTTGLELRLSEGGGGQPNVITFSEDNAFALCLSQDNVLWTCDVITGQCIQVATLGVSRWYGKILGVSYQCQNAAMYTAETPGTVQVMTLLQQQERQSYTGRTGGGHNGRNNNNVTAGTVTIDAEGGVVETDDTVVERQRALLHHNADIVNVFAFSPCSRHAVLGGDHGIVQLYMNLPGTTTTVNATPTTTDQQEHDDGSRTNQQHDNNGDDNQNQYHVRHHYPINRLQGLDAHVTTVTFSPDGKWIAAADWSGRVQVWNIKDITAAKRSDTEKESDMQLGVPKQDGKDVSSCRSHTQELKTVTIKNRDSTNMMMSGPISSLTFTPSSTMIVGTGTDGSVRFWSQASSWR